jgi:glycerol-3-phosphate dehydrogenase (NAD(P)+)
LILGHGEIGHAMEHLLRPRHRLHIWQRHPPPGTPAVDLQEAVADSDFVLFCVPATALAELAARVVPQLRGDALCVTVAKGLGAQARMPVEILTDILGVARVAVLYGPMIAEEICAGKRAYAQCGTSEALARQHIADLYAGTALHIQAARDVVGLSWSAILKNVYAIAFGMADELGLGDNVRGLLMVAALHEVATLVTDLGGDPATPFHLAGLGDLVTTATSASSHHHELGRRIARGTAEQLRGEGVHTLAMLRAAPRFDVAAFPLFRTVDTSVRDPCAAQATLQRFLDRPC